MKRVYHVRDDLRRKLPRTPQFEFSDKKKHYIMMSTRSEGTMGYFEKKNPNQVYTLKIDTGTHKVVCKFVRREDGKRQHDWIVSLIAGLGFALVFFAVFFLLFKMTSIGSAILSAVIGIFIFTLSQLLYRRERRRYIAMLDNYIKTYYGALPESDK